MLTKQLELIEPAEELQEAFLDMSEEYRRAGEDYHQDYRNLAERDFPAYVRRLREISRGIGIAPGHVAMSTFWLVRGGVRILGASRIRHKLTEHLAHEGGHIGYDIRPSERHKGYGTRLLAMTLTKARDLGLSRVLITCRTDNTASARIIEKNGGELADEVISTISNRPVSRYWIEL